MEYLYQRFINLNYRVENSHTVTTITLENVAITNQDSEGVFLRADAIDLNGHTLYVNGVAYSEGTASTGEAITLVTESSSDRSKGGPEGGKHEAPPSGEKPKGDPPSGKKEKKEDS